MTVGTTEARPGLMEEIEVRPLRVQAEYRACVELQRATWGWDFNECVPATILKVTQRVGGLTAGAFDGTGRMVGFVFGVTGLAAGRLAHWSHMLAVLPEQRDGGVGRRLKEYQRQFLVERGIEVAYWTFDPLVARNAHLNLNRLGVEVTEYVRDMYPDTDSALHSGLGTDRFVVAWWLSEGAGRAGVVADPLTFGTLPVANPEGGAVIPDAGVTVRVEIPADIHEVRQASLARAVEWRQTTRAVLEPRLAGGDRVVAFYRDEQGRCYYVVGGESG